jgi:hypothetical protein
MSHRYVALLAIGILCLAAAPGWAQAPLSRPTVSPYLNLNRAGAPPAINYYNLVRPQTQLFGSVANLQQQVNTNRQDIGGVQQNLTLPPTGHSAGFMTQGQYFMTMGRQANSRGILGFGGNIIRPQNGNQGAVNSGLGVANSAQAAGGGR